MASAPAMSHKNLEAAEAYYKAMADKNPQAMEKFLHPDVELVGPLGHVVGKDAVFQAAQQPMKLSKSFRMKAKFASGEQVMLNYDVDFGDPVGVCRTAVLMTFKDGLIARTELFFDARPFEKLPKPSGATQH